MEKAGSCMLGDGGSASVQLTVDEFPFTILQSTSVLEVVDEVNGVGIGCRVGQVLDVLAEEPCYLLRLL